MNATKLEDRANYISDLLNDYFASNYNEVPFDFVHALRFYYAVTAKSISRYINTFKDSGELIVDIDAVEATLEDLSNEYGIPGGHRLLPVERQLAKELNDKVHHYNNRYYYGDSNVVPIENQTVAIN
ncbi:hypothetical protein HN630_00130 [archaeon]|jgi:hypothetical protein|nr:hypothetical protein [archaeon]